VRVDVVTIFPDYFAPLDVALLGKARARGLVDVRVHDLRRWTSDVHRTVDDTPYGGGPGMVMRPEPWWGALSTITGDEAVADRSAGNEARRGRVAGDEAPRGRCAGDQAAPDPPSGEEAALDPSAGGYAAPPGRSADGDAAPGRSAGGDAAPGRSAGDDAAPGRCAGDHATRDSSAVDDAAPGPSAAAAPARQAPPHGPERAARPRPRIVVPTPTGRLFTQAVAAELAAEPWLVFCCGRYEGIDHRVIEAWADDELSVGDYVLAGGEVATLVMVEAVTRLLPGVVGNAESLADDSFSAGLLEGPAYTRPPSWQGRDVPEVLLSGDHARIARWRRDEALRRTARRRPELLERLDLDERDRSVVAGEAAEAVAGDVPGRGG
jgi:tRNA (guanine37-N1)-methyltransferase